MPKLLVEATELKDVDVGFISLVKTPANKIPFRIVKSQTPSTGNTHMTKVNKLFKKASTLTAISAVLIKSTMDHPEKFLEKSGFPTKFKDVGENGEFLFKSSDAEMPDEVTAFKASNDVTILMEGIQKDFRPWSMDGTLTDQAQATAFFPTLYNVMEVLDGKIHDVLYSTTTPSEAASAINDLLSEFSTYVMDSVDMLPEQAFKIAKYANEAPADTPAIEPEGEQKPDTDLAEESAGVSGESTEQEAQATEGGSTPTEDEKITEGEGAKVTDESESEDEIVSENQGEDITDTTETIAEAEGGTGTHAMSHDTVTGETIEVTKDDDTKELLKGIQAALGGLTEKMESLSDSLDVVKESADKSAEELSLLKSSVSYPDDEDPKPASKATSQDDIWDGSALDSLAL